MFERRTTGPKIYVKRRADGREPWKDVRTVNKKFRNAAVGRRGGLIGSLVCLCQAAMPTLRASFTLTPGRANRRKNEGRKEERTDGPTAGQGREGGMDRRRSFGEKQGGKSDGRTEIYRMDIMCVCACVRMCVEGRLRKFRNVM